MATAGTDPPPRRSDGVHVRRATPQDHAGIVALAGTALGWRAGEPNAELFRWKHLDNPFGPSAMWVGEEDGDLVAFRAMLRWRFRWDGRRVEAVRAVDTATRPDRQGRGLFRRLTTVAVDELRAEDVGFVFNTPNDQSRPGYLRMGWSVVGRVPVGVRVRSPASLTRLARARVPADKWSLDTTGGVPAEDVLAETNGLAELLAARPAERGLTTDRSTDYLRWRYRGGPVRYRAAVLDDDVGAGVAFFRLRRRGAAVEATVADLLVPDGEVGRRRALVDQIVRATGADYAISTQAGLVHGAQVRLPGQGPTLTWRPLARATEPPMPAWHLSMGDIELF